MGNRLSIEIAQVKWRTEENFTQEIHVFDDHELVPLLYDGEISKNPAEILMIVCRLEMAGNSEQLSELLNFHLGNFGKGIDIERDWIELDDPRISDIVNAFRNHNRKFFGLAEYEHVPIGKPETVNDILSRSGINKPILSTGGFECDEDVIVPAATSDDSWNHEFEGQIESFRDENTATVMDQEDNAYDVEVHRLKKIE